MNEQINRDDNIALARALITGQLSMLDYVTEDVVMDFPGFACFRGKQEVRDNLIAPLAELLTNSGETVIDNIISEGNQVVLQTRGIGRTTKRGEPYENTYCIIFQFKEGKVHRFFEYCDTALARKVMPELCWSPIQ